MRYAGQPQGLVQLCSAIPPGAIELDVPSLLGGPYSDLWIIDDVAVSVGGAPGVATISRLDKVVTQTTVPELASLALLGTGLLGFGLFRRRARKAA